MRNTGLEEAQAGIKTVGRNINNLRYADDTTLMAESEEELKSFLMKVKVESEKVELLVVYHTLGLQSWLLPFQDDILLSLFGTILFFHVQF